MKKIVALVLSLVMALSLATVAFAADEYTLTIFDKDAEDRYTVATSVKAKLVKADYDDDEEYGWVDYYEGDDNCNYAVVTDAKKAEFAVKDGDKTVYIKNVTGKEFGEIFYDVEAKKVDKVYKWNCETGVHAAGYLDEDNTLYVKADDKWDADTDYAVLVGKEIIKVYVSADVKPGTHVLTKVGTTDNRQVNEYKCVVCNKLFYGTQDPAVAKDEDSNYFAYDGKAVADATYGYVTVPEFTKLVDENLYVWAKDGETTKPANGVNSPKTFDAGIAMYVGMSLLSVAGGAVVIGKKKEF